MTISEGYLKFAKKHKARLHRLVADYARRSRAHYSSDTQEWLVDGKPLDLTNPLHVGLKRNYDYYCGLVDMYRYLLGGIA